MSGITLAIHLGVPLGIREALDLVLSPQKCEYLYRSPGHEDPGPLPRPVQVGPLMIQQVSHILYLSAAITEQPLVRQRVRKAQRLVAALLPILGARPLPPQVLDRIYSTSVAPALLYEQSTASATKRTRATLRREDTVMRAAIQATARMPHRPPILPAAMPRTVNRLLRVARVRYLGRVLRRPEGHPLRRASTLDLGRRNVGRPCFAFRDTVAQDMERLAEPPEGWPALLQSRLRTATYLRNVEPTENSSGEEDVHAMDFTAIHVEEEDWEGKTRVGAAGGHRYSGPHPPKENLTEKHRKCIICRVWKFTGNMSTNMETHMPELMKKKMTKARACELNAEPYKGGLRFWDASEFEEKLSNVR
ncbi:Zinc finger protein STP3 [Frankliniella fusca]|uniref:Zinc finger protein STP3 n=1 Tax=Frankliniella fusca TaxID=407009 RepID=A0AAE1I135_9NEOP|nr:Zinc finger protein STP3 [Frankliniella fusca]